MENTDSMLPWVEKYRPKTLIEILGQEKIVSRLKSYVGSRNVPNMLFAGPAGIGKTSAALALSRELFGDGLERNFLELNASDSRGIDVVRNQIKEFARTLAFNSGFKIIFLDESDALTADAQQALRRTMERYTKTCRFILSCNYSSRIIEPIQSRCVVFRFSPLPEIELTKKLNLVASDEKVKMTDDGAKAIIYVSEGDARKALNVLQATAAVAKVVNEEAVYEVSSKAKPQEIKQLIQVALDKNFLEARNKLDILLQEKGMSGEDILFQIYREIVDMDEAELDSKSKIDLLHTIGEYEFRLVEGSNERLQLEAMIAQFMKYKK